MSVFEPQVVLLRNHARVRDTNYRANIKGVIKYIFSSSQEIILARSAIPSDTKDTIEQEFRKESFSEKPPWRYHVRLYEDHRDMRCYMDKQVYIKAQQLTAPQDSLMIDVGERSIVIFTFLPKLSLVHGV
jgi:hypothetical protein